MTEENVFSKERGYEDLGLYKLDGKSATGEALETLKAAVRKVLDSRDGALFVCYDPRDGAAVRLCQWAEVKVPEREDISEELSKVKCNADHPELPSLLGRLLLTYRLGDGGGRHVIFIGMNPSVAAWLANKKKGGDETAGRLRKIVGSGDWEVFKHACAITIVNLAPVVHSDSEEVPLPLKDVTKLLEINGMSWPGYTEGKPSCGEKRLALNALDRLNLDMLSVLVAEIAKSDELLLVPMWGNAEEPELWWKISRAPEVIKVLKAALGGGEEIDVFFVPNITGTPRHLLRRSESTDPKKRVLCKLSELPHSAVLDENVGQASGSSDGAQESDGH